METQDSDSVRNDDEIRRLCDIIRQTAYEVHVYFGTGFLEKVYENALAHRLSVQGIKVASQVHMTVRDEDGHPVGTYEADLIVEDKIILELKAVRTLTTAHEAQLINYLKTTGIQDGMLINFGAERFEILKRISESRLFTPQFIVEQTESPSL